MSGSASKEKRAQEARRVEIMREEVEDLQEQVTERLQELNARGVGVNPMLVQACQVEILIRWAAPSEYGRARFDLQVAKQVLAQLQDEVVDPVMNEKIAQARAFAEEQRLASEGKNPQGLYIPGTNEVLAATANPMPASPPTEPSPALKAVPAPGVIGPPTVESE